MFKLDNDFLTSLGLGSLPVDEKNKLLQAIYERLEMNVGMRLAEKMTDQQLNEFEGFIDRNDEAGALRWLETNFPNYKQVVSEELEKLRAEIAQSAPHILAAAQESGQTQQATNPQPASPAQPYYGEAANQQPQYQSAQPQPPVQQPYNPPATPQSYPANPQQGFDQSQYQSLQNNPYPSQPTQEGAPSGQPYPQQNPAQTPQPNTQPAPWNPYPTTPPDSQPPAGPPSPGFPPQN